MRLRVSIASVLLVIVANGCSDSIGAGAIAGLWRENGNVPGSALEMLLTLNGTVVSGQGSWCGEALGCGSTTVTGTATGSKIHLVTTFSNGRVETFDGALLLSNSLVGTVTETPAGSQTQVSSSQSFSRFVQDPPGIQ